ncbi:hypothetical protein FBQ82_13850 [Anaerolineae bacterium CFX7]|nr:hypothetical protein [Anaerolineae bacterium CFX7]
MRLVAPKVGAKQQQYSGFMVNGMTDAQFFLQSGLALTSNEPSFVFWTDDSVNLVAQHFDIPYVVGAVYQTEVVRFNGSWYMCAGNDADIGNTWRCQQSIGGGNKLIWDWGANTSVWFENWNPNKNWKKGFNNPFVAFGALSYVNGNWQPWQADDLWTADACAGAWPVGNAITGWLRNGGQANFWKGGIPLYANNPNNNC